MTNVTIPFSANSKEDWQHQLLKELKENKHLLQYSNELEDLHISLTELEAAPVNALQSTSEPWKRTVCGNATQAITTNQFFLDALMQGADALLIDQTNCSTDWPLLLNGIGSSYISNLIVFNDSSAFEHFMQNAPADAIEHCIPLLSFGPERNFFSTFELQQVGANCSTELAYSLFELHQHLSQEPRSKIIYAELGVGAEFLVEIAKFSAFRQLVAQLGKWHNCQIEVRLLVKTGFCNKSLKDPYTNLLRLSTESLSAVLANADFLCIQPYDALSNEGPSAFAQRMALNIGNLLAEEAHLAALNTPLAGAYAIEAITSQLIEKSWDILHMLDQNPDAFHDQLKLLLAQTIELRKARFDQKADLLIGINAFENEFETPKATWGPLPSAFDFPYLIFEKTRAHV